MLGIRQLDRPDAERESLKLAADYFEMFRPPWEERFDWLDTWSRYKWRITMNSFSYSRVFSAPRSLVFDCWVNPAHFGKWFGPANCTFTIRQVDDGLGGYLLKESVWRDGTQFFEKFQFRQIKPIDFLELMMSFCTKEGELAKHPFLSPWPDFILANVTFEDADGGTKVTMGLDPVDAADDEVAFYMKNLHNFHQGSSEVFDRLTQVLEDLRVAEKALA